MKELGEISTDLPPTQHFTSHLLEYNRPLVGWSGTGLGVLCHLFLSELLVHEILEKLTLTRRSTYRHLALVGWQGRAWGPFLYICFGKSTVY